MNPPAFGGRALARDGTPWAALSHSGQKPLGFASSRGLAQADGRSIFGFVLPKLEYTILSFSLSTKVTPKVAVIEH
jgi:hypothetical protein